MNNATAVTTASINGGPAVGADMFTETDLFDVTTRGKTVPDMEWEYVDKRGHYHAWTDAKSLPTLDARSEHVECDVGHSDNEYECEGYDVTVYSCRICSEIVEPKTHFIPSTSREFARGRTSWTVRTGPTDVRQGQTVSVVLRAGPQLSFGVGVVIGSGPGGVEIVGVGELGHRSARRAA